MVKAKKLKISFIVSAGFLITIIMVFYTWSLFYYKASENAISGLKSNDFIEVIPDKNIAFILKH